MKDRPGLVVFVGGVGCLLAATALGFFLAHKAQVKSLRVGLDDAWSPLNGVEIGDDHAILSNVNALIWMVFGLGTCLTLIGLRMLTRPNLDFRPSPPLGSIRQVFENPE